MILSPMILSFAPKKFARYDFLHQRAQAVVAGFGFDESASRGTASRANRGRGRSARGCQHALQFNQVLG